MNIEEWKYFFDKSVKRKEDRAEYLSYLKSLQDKGFPPIFELDHLSKLVGLEPAYLSYLIAKPEQHYRTYTIPKRTGGTREIAAPQPPLLAVQRWISKEILSAFSVSNFAHGFVEKKSIITNARIHVGTKCLLKMDIKDFFGTIKFKRVFGLFRYCGYTSKVSYYLASLCCLGGKLPQGAATSPALSNIISRKLDIRLSKLAHIRDLNYSRYADDLAFSGPYIPVSAISMVETIVNGEGFKINHDKTRLIRGKGKKILTGISISGKATKLPRQTRRELRAEFHQIKCTQSFQNSNRFSDPLYLERVLGKFSFWRQIEPENVYVKESIEYLSKLRKTPGRDLFKE